MGMCFNIQIPDEAAGVLSKAWGSDLPRRALEGVLIEAYRRGDISVGFLGRTLGMGVVAADRWLAERGVPLTYSKSDLADDIATLRAIDAARDGGAPLP